MRKLLATLAIAATGLVVCNVAEAKGTHGGNSGTSLSTAKTNGKNSNYTKSYTKSNDGHKMGSHDKSKDYNQKYGTKFEHGYFYKGKFHDHWTCSRYDRRYGCNVYWDPCCLCWYYYCTPCECFYPVSYCPYSTYCWEPVATPVIAEQPVTEVAVPECPPPVCTTQYEYKTPYTPYWDKDKEHKHDWDKDKSHKDNGGYSGNNRSSKSTQPTSKGTNGRMGRSGR
jgi:hypothetical protein